MTVLRNSFGRCNWLGRISIILIIGWLLTIFLSINRIFKGNPNNLPDHDQNLKENFEKLIQMSNDFQVLKKQNNVLRNIILGNTLELKENYLGNVTDKNPKGSVYYDFNWQHQFLKSNFSEPSLQYEEIRRRIRNDVQEMWYFISEDLNNVRKKMQKYNFNSEMEASLENINEYYKWLVININKLADADGHMQWREQETLELSNLVQQRFRYLQNPVDCNTAKKLVCNINKGCGFGCQVHHLVYCFLAAYGTQRTLILKSKGWRYQKEGWESVFKPLSDTCLSTNGQTYANWPGDETKQVVALPIVDNVYPKPIFQPPSVPADIADRLKKIHGYPLVWWVGQVLKYLMRPNDETKSLLENKKIEIKFSRPIVGVHIRRTDKVGTEAAFHDVDEYMYKVKQYFEKLESPPKIKRVFLASDDPKVITTAKQRYPEFEFIADTDIAQTASISRRYSNLSLQGIIIDIHFLSLCDYLVCTFSSQVCRVAYELMQTRFPDAYNRFASLDDIYYFGGQNPHPQLVVISHIPKKEGEIELKVNDEVEVHGNHWNGYSKGKNLRTKITGLFPSYKIINPVKEVDFPSYKNVPTTE